MRTALRGSWYRANGSTTIFASSPCRASAAAMERHGPDAKVAVLPFARYQLPRNAVRMASEEPSILAYVGA